MIRTQIYITEEQARDIKLQAKREHKPEAEVIRELLSEGLKTTKGKRKESTGEALLRLAKVGEQLGATGRNCSPWEATGLGSGRGWHKI